MLETLNISITLTTSRLVQLQHLNRETITQRDWKYIRTHISNYYKSSHSRNHAQHAPRRGQTRLQERHSHKVQHNVNFTIITNHSILHSRHHKTLLLPHPRPPQIPLLRPRRPRQRHRPALLPRPILRRRSRPLLGPAPFHLLRPSSRTSPRAPRPARPQAHSHFFALTAVHRLHVAGDAEREETAKCISRGDLFGKLEG